MVVVSSFVPVPPVERRPERWEVPHGMTSRRARERGTGTYFVTSPARISTLTLDLPSGLAAHIADAENALASFDEHSSATFGSLGQPLGPMSSILLRSESASSSQIENLTVGARQLALAVLNENTSSHASLVLGNVRSMEAALSLAESLDVDALLEMNVALLPDGGRLRESLVWVGSSSFSPVGAAHVAPHASDVPEALDDLIAFARRTDMPVLLQAAIAHAQFETIHPFIDGNGRVGRALVHAMLAHHGLVTSTTVPISGGLLRNTKRYFDALTAYREGNAAPIIECFADAALASANDGRELADRLSHIAREAENTLRNAGVRRHSYAYPLVQVLVGQPVVNTVFVREKLGVNTSVAQRAITTLTELDILTERTGRKRGRVWHCTAIIDALEEYAERSRRA